MPVDIGAYDVNAYDALLALADRRAALMWVSTNSPESWPIVNVTLLDCDGGAR